MQPPDWNKNMKKYNTQKLGEREVQKTLKKWCALCKVFQCVRQINPVSTLVQTDQTPTTHGLERVSLRAP